MGWVTQMTVVILPSHFHRSRAFHPSLVAIIVILQSVGFPESAIATGVGIVTP